MSYSFWDGVLDVLSGGAYSATRAATSAVKNAAEQDTDSITPSSGDKASGALGPTHGQLFAVPGIGLPSGNVSGRPSRTVPEPVYLESKCCGYVIEGDYLLNSITGQVWLIDKEKMELLQIRRSMLPLESAASALNLDLMRKFLLEQKDLEIGKFHHSERGGFSKKVDTLIGALDKEIAINIKASER